MENQLSREYEEWLDETVGKDGREELAKEAPDFYATIFMDFIVMQLNQGAKI